MPNAARNEGWASASPEARADDLHAAFADDEVGVVLCAIGGNHSNQVLPHLDFDGYEAGDVETLWEAVAARTERAGIPVLAGVDCGHTDPMTTIPLGVPARLDAQKRTLEVLLPGA